MLTDWRELPIGDIAEVIGGGTPSTKDENNFNGDIPWLTPKDLSGYPYRYISRGERSISQKGLMNSSARLLPQGAVLLTTRAPVGYVAIASNPTTTNQGFRSLVLHEGYHPEFVYYLLKLNTERLKGYASGSTFGELSGSALKELRFLFPPLPEQRAIAAILGALDDKIELNRRLNETLEAMAGALFKSWFVDFDPFRDQGMEDSPLGAIPTGWRAASLRELYSHDSECVITGPFGSTLHAHDYRDSGTSLILVKHVNRGHIDETGLPLVGGHKLPELARYRLRAGDIVFTRVGAVGRSALIYPRHEGWLISGQMLRVRVQGGQVHPRYLAQLYLTDEFIDMVEAYALGTTRPSLNTTILQDLRFICPPASIQRAFAKRVHPLDLKVQHNLIESQTLATIRDALVPRLLSGEIRVKEAEKFVGGVV